MSVLFTGTNENLKGFENLLCVTNVVVVTRNYEFTCCVLRIDLKLGVSPSAKETLRR